MRLYILVIIVLLGSCKKGSDVPPLHMGKLKVEIMITGTPATDVYINGQKDITREDDYGIDIPIEGQPLQVTLKRRSDGYVMADTLLSSFDKSTSLPYYYLDGVFSQFGNQGIGAPSPDVFAIRLKNNYNHGTGKIHLYIYKARGAEGFGYDPGQLLFSELNLPFGAVTSTILLPGKDAQQNPLRYSIITTDSDGYDPGAESLIDFGMDPVEWGGMPFPDEFYFPVYPGKFSLIEVKNDPPVEYNGKTYYFLTPYKVFEQ